MTTAAPTGGTPDDRARRAPATGGTRRAVSAGVFVLACLLVVVGCGGDSGAGSARPAPPGDLTIVAKDYKFVPDTVSVPVGRDITIVVDNRDAKTGHNIHFTTLPGGPKTKVELGPVYQTIVVRFDQPGRYPFVCDVHPAMTGTAVAG